MKFRDQLAWTLLLQGGGAAAGLATIFLLGFYLGPVAQGAFSLVKIEIAFIGSLAIFGLTQSLAYYVQSSRMSIKRARYLAIVVAVVGGLIALGYAIFMKRWSGGVAVAFAVASAAYAWFGCLRGVVLAAASTRKFNALTALPQFMLLLYAGVAVVLASSTGFDVSVAFLAAYALSAIIGLRWLAGPRRIALPLAAEERLPSVMLYGFASGIAEIAANASLLLAVKAVAENLAVGELGVFTFAMTVVQGLLVPFSYSLPILFKRWMLRPDAGEAMKGGIFVLSIFGGLALLVGLIFNNLDLGSWLGAYSTMEEALWILLLAAGFDGYQRVLVAHSNAQGAPWHSATSETLRLLVVIGCISFLPVRQVADMAWIVCFAAMASLVMVLAARKLTSRANVSLVK